MRSTAPRCRVRLAAVAVAVAMLLTVACDGGGGLRKGVDYPNFDVSTVTLAWAEASGPVAGYAVFVQRDGGNFEREQNVSVSQVTLEGDVGGTAVVAVAAYDSQGNLGPGSGASAPFTFPDPDDVGAPLGSAAAQEQTASATTRSLPASGGGAATAGAPGDGPDGTGSEPAGDGEGAETEPEAEPLAAADLVGALLWSADDALRVTDSTLRTVLLATAPPAGELLGTADFDGDGAPDLLWSDGALLAYTPLAHGAPTLDFASLGPGEAVAAAGDFDGDGAADLVLRDARGGLGVWLTGAGAPDDSLGVQGEARLAGVADFDGDGRDDLLWREPDGALSLWLMDALRAHTTLELAADPALEVVGTGDFDGDGAAELALRAADGALFHHEPLDGRSFAAGNAPASRWRAVGAADVDGDGRDDLVLAAADALRGVSLPEGAAWEQAIDPASPWELVALLP